MYSTKTCTELEIKKNPIPSKKRMTKLTINLTRESPPLEPVEIVEERPQKKKKIQVILEWYSKAT
jgi:hypothetical protein